MKGQSPADLIAEIFDHAVRDISEDPEHPDTPPPDWQEIRPIMEWAPEFVAALHRIACWGDGYQVHPGMDSPDDAQMARNALACAGIFGPPA